MDRYLFLRVDSGGPRLSDTAYAHVTLSLCGKDARDEPTWDSSATDGKGVAIACQIDSDCGDPDKLMRSYAWRVGIALGTDIHPEVIGLVDRAAKLVRKMEKSFNTNVAKFGYPSSFGQFVAYHLDGMKIQGMMERRSTGNYVTHARDMIACTIDSRVEDALKVCRKQMGKSEDFAA